MRVGARMAARSIELEAEGDAHGLDLMALADALDLAFDLARRVAAEDRMRGRDDADVLDLAAGAQRSAEAHR